MKTSKLTFQDHLRMIWTITAKDIGDAVKNKNAITVIGLALFVVILYRLIPILTSTAEAPELIIADLDRSELVAQLAEGEAFQVYSRPDEQAMLTRSSVSEAPNLALVIPAGFDQMLEQGDTPELQGFTLYWVKQEKAEELRQRAEAELSRLAGQLVKIKSELTSIYPAPEDNSLANWATFTLLYTLIMISLPLIPNLMLEEKQTHTLDALLVSPASAWDLAAGKILTSVFYTILIAAVILAAYSSQILQWGLIWMVVLLGALFLAPLGLLVGQKVESRGQLGMLVWIVLIPLLAPVVITLIKEFFPTIVVQIVRFLPTGALMSLAQRSFVQTVALDDVLLDLGIILLWAVPLVGFLVWSIRRMDRIGAAKSTKFSATSPTRISLDEAERANIANQELDRPDSATAIPDLAKVLEMSEGRKRQPGKLRIILTIAAKDLHETLRNKVPLMILVIVLLMILLNSGLPLLLRGRVEPFILIYDAGRSELVRSLVQQADPRIDLARTQQEMENGLSELPQTILGLSLPADFDQRLRNGETIVLDSALIHWADREIASELANQFSAAIARLAPGAVSIDSQARVVYPAIEGFNQSYMIAQMLAFILLVIGLALVPILLVEEKESHTIEALFVSPATPGLVVVGKALVGCFYGFLAAVIVIVLNNYLFVNWGVVLLAILAGVTFAVALGLLIGALSNNPATVGLWGGLALMSLIAAGLLSLFSNANWPAWLRQFLYWLPSGSLIRLIRSAMLGTPQLWVVLGSAGVLFALAGIIYILAELRLRRMV